VADDDPPSRGGSKAAASGLFGLLIGGLAAAFVIRTIVRDRAAIEDALADASPGWLLAGGLLAATGMTLIALPWRRALNLFGVDMPWGQLVSRYFLGELGKYLPGGVWPILGRGELAHRYGIRRPAAYGSVGLSLVALYLGALFVVGAGLPALLAGEDGTGPIAVLLLLPVGLLCLHPRVVGGAVAVVERLTKRHLDLAVPSWRDSVTLVALYVPSWLAIGGATWAVARSLDPSAGLVEVGAAAVLSWVVGFVLVPVPGGVGVREAAFVAAAGALDPGIAAATALAARLLFVLVDATGALLGWLWLRRGGRRTGAQLDCTLDDE
jgi:uncharacterized membrane protein YbhN (UPF0104 family)